MSLYFILLLASAGVPLALSFDKRLQFYKKWRFVFPAITIVAIVYILFDIVFTRHGIWGFNPRYLSGITLLNLPLEEILFFFAIPYASLFLHDSFVEYFPKTRLNSRSTQFITIIFIILSLGLAFFNTEKVYTFYISLKVFVVLLLSLFDKSRVIQRFLVTFLLILVPFVIVNGILTGTGIEQEVVWYNNSENLGIRVFTIPVEDFGYAFSLILFNLLLIEKFQNTFNKQR
jgi:lycopene cyclase domain-containing protein